MNIKFIKDSNTFKEGDVTEVEALYANAFVAMGYAEEVEVEVEDKPKTKAKSTVKPDSKEKTATKKTTK